MRYLSNFLIKHSKGHIEFKESKNTLVQWSNITYGRKKKLF